MRGAAAMCIIWVWGLEGFRVSLNILNPAAAMCIMMLKDCFM
jgi:hypothetical protein